MLKFYKNIIRSYVDIPNKTSFILHNLNCKCNMNCYKCFNYNELIKKEQNDYYLEDDILNIIQKQGYLFDCLILSGGEFLLNDLKLIESFILKVKKIYNGKIIIYTNGSSPNKVEYLLDNRLVDGFHIDMKLPYHLMDINEDKDIFKNIIGIIPSKNFIINILKSINIIVKHNSSYSQVRTVKYPILPDDFFEEIRNYIAELNQLYNTSVQYKLNDFISVGDD